MPEQKTRPTEQSVDSFINDIRDEARRADCLALTDLMKRVTNEEPQIWGSGVVGFGNYHYKYASGHEGDSFIAGFAPRKSGLTLSMTAGLRGFPTVLDDLG